MRLFVVGIVAALAVALSSSDPAFAACSNPAGIAGQTFYNIDFHVPQYCDNTNWIAMVRQVPGTGGSGCSNPAGIEGQMFYSADYRVLQYCDGTYWRAMGPVGGGGKWVRITAGGNHSCGIKNDGTLWCWGDDSSAQLGNGAVSGSQPSPSEESTAATDWAEVEAGNGHTCAIKTNGTLWCWGWDSNGQLGEGGGTGLQPSPVQESTAATDWAEVESGYTHTCAVKTNGTLWCWGNDGNGRLGNGAATGDMQSPSQESTAATNWASVSAGTAHTCAVKTNGTLWCWGDDTNGKLGNGGVTGDQISPSQESTAATDWATVTAGNLHTCAVKTTGTLWCWGGDASGQLGNGAVTGNQTSPYQESTAATDWLQISVGSSGYHTCATKGTGTLWCWGAAAYGRLGDGGVTDQPSPSQESTTAADWVQVAAGDQHTCAIKTNGRVWCWGRDDNGELGNGAITGDQTNPVANIECLVPQGDEGALLYNSSSNVMQYCDGVDWMSIGK